MMNVYLGAVGAFVGLFVVVWVVQWWVFRDIWRRARTVEPTNATSPRTSSTPAWWNKWQTQRRPESYGGSRRGVVVGRPWMDGVGCGARSAGVEWSSRS